MAFTIERNAREVAFRTQDGLGNNHTLRFKKIDGEFTLLTERFAYSNWGIQAEKFKLEWLADEGKWTEILTLINEGYERVNEVVSR